MENNGHSAKVRPLYGHFTRVHSCQVEDLLNIHAKFEDLLITSAIIGKANCEQRGMLHQDYQLLGENKTKDN